MKPDRGKTEVVEADDPAADGRAAEAAVGAEDTVVVAEADVGIRPSPLSELRGTELRGTELRGTELRGTDR